MGALLIFGALSALLPAAPAAADVQRAYEAAKAQGGSRHEDDLMIRTAQCRRSGGGRWACQIDFVRAAEPRGRLYFTLVTLQNKGDGWTLIGGLCRGPA
jgi:hypothetical protein